MVGTMSKTTMHKTVGNMPPDGYEWDPTFRNARRETWVILGVWGACMLWSVPYCYLNGYITAGQSVNPGDVAYVWGMPKWAFFGVFVPWLLADVATTVFCFWYMADDNLGEAHEGADLEEAIAEDSSTEARR